MKNTSVERIATLVRKNGEIKTMVNNAFREAVQTIEKELKGYQVKIDGSKPFENYLKINSEAVAHITLEMVVQAFKSQEDDIYEASQEEITRKVYGLIEQQIRLQ